MKSYTDLEQSNKLAEFLPLESADMYYSKTKILNSDETDYIVKVGTPIVITDVPCWSLAALLSVLPNGTDICKNIEGRYYVHGFFSDNPVDACVDAIKALHEQNLL